MDDKEVIKKVLTGQLTDREKALIADQSPVLQHLKEQWGGMGDSSFSQQAKGRVLNRIVRRIHSRGFFHYSLIRYAGAASLALLISIVSWLIGQQGRDAQTVYVVSAGRQSMEVFYLPDGSHVLLNAGGQLTYPETFDGKKREVVLTGQAFFEVRHDTEHPFIVKTKNMDVKALGTSFEVFSVDSLSYTEMILVEGSVEATTRKEQGKGEVLLVKPNEKLTCGKDGKTRIVKVDADCYSSWRREGKPSFKNEKLDMIVPRLESWYGEKIECPVALATKYSFTFSIHNESLELLLDIISKSSPVAYRKRGDGFVLYENTNK